MLTRIDLTSGARSETLVDLPRAAALFATGTGGVLAVGRGGRRAWYAPRDEKPGWIDAPPGKVFAGPGAALPATGEVFLATQDARPGGSFGLARFRAGSLAAMPWGGLADR